MKLNVKIYSSIKDRAFGLIGHKKAEPVLFYTRWGIHTIRLKFPIDVLVLDKDDVVVKLTENLKPNRFFVWPPKYNKVIELPAGFIKKLGIGTGNKINLEMVE